MYTYICYLCIYKIYAKKVQAKNEHKYPLKAVICSSYLTYASAGNKFTLLLVLERYFVMIIKY